MAVLAARSLFIGLISGLLLALLLQNILAPRFQSPDQDISENRLSTDSPLQLSESMAQMLSNTLRAARYRAWVGGGYKSVASPLRLTPQSSIISSTTTTTTTTTTTPNKLASSSSAFSTTSPSMSAQKSFLDAIKERRTIYALNKESPVSDKRITELAELALLNVPSSFNSQSTRLVVLLNKDHDQFWDYVLEVLKPLTPEDKFAGTQQRVGGFKAGYGTILFYEDPEPVEALRKAFPPYAHHFGDWSEQTNAMHQFALWVALEAEGFGANLQHYNPVVDPKAAEHWKIPLDWKLRAQLVFGGRAGGPGEKESKPTHGTRLFVHGAKI